MLTLDADERIKQLLDAPSNRTQSVGYDAKGKIADLLRIHQRGVQRNADLPTT